MSTITRTRAGRTPTTEARRSLRYSAYIWLFQAGLGLLFTLFVLTLGVAEALLVGVLAVGLPAVMYHGLQSRSRLAWYAHMVLSVLSITSLVGILGLYFGWKGRAAVGT